MPVRYDVGSLEKPKKQPNGWLRADGYVTRTGVFVYRRHDGKESREYRPPEEVFKQDSLDSFNLVPLTNDHPSDGLLTADNTKEHQVGSVISPKADGRFMRAQFLVTDAQAIRDLESGKSQLSGGYVCDLDETPGVTPEGERYDARQINIVGNHVAIVSKGRAGPDVKLRMDSACLVLDEQPDTVLQAKTVPDCKAFGREDQTMAVKIKIDSVECEVSEVAAALIDKQVKASEAALSAAVAKSETAAAKADALEVELKAAKKELAAIATERAKAARAELESKAAEVLGETKFDGLSDLQVKALVVEHVTGVKMDGRSETYVEVAFDMALTRNDTEEPEAEIVKTVAGARADAGLDPVEAARAKYQAALDKVQPQ